MADLDPRSPRAGANPARALLQTVYLLVGLLVVSGVAGVLMAGFLLPAVSLTSSATDDGVELFNSYPTELKVEPLNQSSRIEAADGSLLATFYYQNRVMVPLEEISPYVQHAVVAEEDRRFYEHGGIDIRGTARALLSNSAGGSTQGGSTLTQQYVKNALLMDAQQRGDDEAKAEATEQTYGRKAREAKLAISLEKEWSKDEILGAYLNVAQFGPSQYGVETGSQHYFSKPAKDLGPGEAALLAGITNGPNLYDPVKNPERAEKRRNEVLRAMLRDGYITQEQYDEASALPVTEMLKVQNVSAGCASAGRSGFFCDYVTRSLMNDPSFGETPADRRKKLYGGGLTIRTTLDVGKQKAAEDLLEARLPATDDSGFGHSIVTVEPGTGNVLVMAQNRTFNPYEEVGPGETAINYNVPKALGGGSGFPVGSTFKPFVLTEWLKTGHSIWDTVGTARQTMTTFPAKCLPGGAWRERRGYNPDNAVSVALAPMEPALNATKFSINTSYANMARQMDLCDIASTARTLGVVPATFNPFNPETQSMPVEDLYGQELAPSVVVLGELRISALDMASAYATFGASGTYCRPTAITAITDRAGKDVAFTGNSCKQVLDKQVADSVAWTLEQDLADPRATGKGKVIPGHDAGGKTGTSSEQFHTWYVGFTRQMSTAVWFGNPTSNVKPGGFTVGDTYLRRGSVWGNTVSLPTWQQYMITVHEGLPNEPFPGEPGRPAAPARGAQRDGTVPDVSGMVLSTATSTLEGAGYKVTVRREPSADVEKWRVIGTDPAPGTPLTEGRTVTIRQSTGKG
ncbi:penicillin-binding protein [Brachybacterium hainanense]|uniref:Penicillin-binding protein n=1 Tax=Brachybacterium hainanense TaxID=1541174 RepID=A0ABV6RF44_9MICO